MAKRNSELVGVYSGKTKELQEKGDFLATSFSVKFRTILTEISKAPPRAVALASYLGEGYSSTLNRTPVKDLMAFGSVLQHTPHNIGTYLR